jgi:hypothetical protein
MAEAEIPDQLSRAIRVGVFWVALPFILLLVGIERISDQAGNRYQVAGCILAALLSIWIAVRWSRLLPRRWRPATDAQLAYLRGEDSELGSAIRHMAWRSAYGKWFASQTLALSGRPDEGRLMQVAAGEVLDALTDGRLEARGRRPGQLDYRAGSSDTSGLGTPPEPGPFLCAYLATRKNRQGFPRRLVPLRLRGSTLRRAVLERGASSCLDALPQLGGWCVASVSGQRSPIAGYVLLALMLIKLALLS